jgi:hypothetical protein
MTPRRAGRSAFCAAALLVLLSGTARAQGYYSFMTYNTGAPMAGTADYVGGYSFTGIGLEGGKYLSERLAFGVSLAWNVFDKDSNEVITFPNGAISGDQTRYLNMAPFMLTARYEVPVTRGIRTLLGLNLGGYYIDRLMEFGQFRFQEANWHFGVAPQLGVTFPVTSSILGLVDARYNRAFAAGDESRSYSYLGINIGLGVLYR